MDIFTDIGKGRSDKFASAYRVGQQVEEKVL